MNFVDWTVLGVVGVSALLGLTRGLVREVLGIAAWSLAAFGAWRLGPLGFNLARSFITAEELAETAAYSVCFLGLLIGFSLASNLAGRLVQLSSLGGLDRTLGVVFGLARGSLMMIGAYVLGGLVQSDATLWPQAVQQSRTIPWVYDGARWLAGNLPEQYRPRLVAPPQGKPASADQLLHATPEGRALGPRPTHI